MLESLAASARRRPDPVVPGPPPATAPPPTGHRCRLCGTPHVGMASVCGPCSRAAQYQEEAVARRRQRQAQARPGQCQNCGGVTLPRQRSRGRCARCDGYFRRTGRERPRTLRAPWPCRACGQPTQPGDGRGRGLCTRCLARLKSPPRVRTYAPAAPCRTCGGPAPLGQRGGGECLRCRNYRNKTGRPRPPHLWPGSTAPRAARAWTAARLAARQEVAAHA